jgi:hypothetical protein
MYATVPRILPSAVACAVACSAVSSWTVASEVEDLHPPVVPDHHVGGLEVAVHDAALMRRADRVGQRDGDLQQIGERHPRFRNVLRQRLAFHELHRDEEEPLVFFDGVDGDDAGMVERGDGAGFAFEAGAPVGVAGRLARQHFERDLASELEVVGEKDLAHAARAERADDAVMGQGLANHGGYGRIIAEAQPSSI